MIATPLYDTLKDEQGYDPEAYHLRTHAEFLADHKRAGEHRAVPVVETTVTMAVPKVPVKGPAKKAPARKTPAKKAAAAKKPQPAQG